jgi:hypothetical protein
MEVVSRIDMVVYTEYCCLESSNLSQRSQTPPVLILHFFHHILGINDAHLRGHGLPHTYHTPNRWQKHLTQSLSLETSPSIS